MDTIKEIQSKEIADEPTLGYSNQDLIASSYNAIAAVEAYNAMTQWDTETITKIKRQSLRIIEICIDELYDYTTNITE